MKTLNELLSSARLVCRIFYSLNSPGLTEVRLSPLTRWPALGTTALAHQLAQVAAGAATLKHKR